MMTPFEWVVGDSSKDHTVTALTSVTTSPVTERYTTMRDSTQTSLLTERLIEERDRLTREIAQRVATRQALTRIIEAAPPLPPQSVTR